jgi:hypothetical protein
MIENRMQYNITKAAKENLVEALANVPAEKENVDPALLQLEKEGIQSEIDTLDAEIKEYEMKNPNLRK